MEDVQLFNEDCLQTLNRLDDQSVDLLLQDPPYGVTKNAWDVKPILEILWPQWLRVAKPNAPIIFFSQQPFTSELVVSCLRLFRYDLIWYKPLGSGFLSAKKMPMRNHEHILVFYQHLPTYNPVMGVGIRKRGKRPPGSLNRNYGKFGANASYFDDRGTRYPQSIIEFSNGNRQSESFHPVQKPLDLIRYLIMTFSNQGDLVFDGYMGSGTTPVACVIENRRFVGAETNLDYYRHAKQRVNMAQEDRPLF